MKNIILLIVAFSFIIQCNAQTKTINITEIICGTKAGLYYKDIDNNLDAFVGTWLYTKGKTSFKIVLKKEIKYCDGRNYQDLLIGEYQYIRRGKEKINTLPQLDTISPSRWDHEISGNRFSNKHDKPKCKDCLPNEKRVNLIITDPIKQLEGKLILRRILVDGEPALEADRRTTTRYEAVIRQTGYEEMLVPRRKYTLIKQ